MAANNGFKIVQFSPELIQALTQMGELRTRINDYAVEEFKNYKGEEKLDHRDFVEMMNLSPEKSEKEQKEYVRNFVRDYTSGDPELRKKCLDDIYDRDDSFNPASLDLSCLKGTDTGPREPGGLTGSEKDFMSLIGAFRREQALSVKLKENPGYAQERYGSDSRKRAEFEARRTAMMNGLISYTDNMLRNNGFNERLHRGNVAPMAGDGEYVAADLAVNLYRNSMDRLQGGRTGENRLNFSLGPENGNIYGLSRQLAAGNLTNQMKTNAAAAFDTSLATLYRSGLPATTMNEMGVDALDLIHVDGLSARERYGNKYANLSEWEQNKMIKAEVMGAIMDGQRVDAVTLGLGARGRMQAVTHTLEADLHAYDQMEKRSEHSGFRRLFDWGPGKIRTKADNVDRKNREDRQMEERTGLITNSIASRLEARESKQYLMENLGMSPKPVTPQIQRQEEKLRGIEGRIGDIEKQNFSSYEEIGNISRELERRKVYEGAREKFNKAKSKLDTTKAVMDNGNLLEVDIREVMDPIIPDYGPDQKEKLGNSYDNDFLPGYYKLDEIRTARDLSQEKLEARRDRLNASLDQGQKKNEYRLEAVNRLLDAKTPEEREKVIGDTLEEFKKGAQAHLEQCEDTLNSHPCGEMSPEQIQEKEKRLQVLEEGLTPVPQELLQERAMEEARLNQLKEMNGEDRTPQIKKFNQAELLHPDYIPPATKEEALARIGELDAKYGPEIQYLDRREMVKNFRAQDLSTIDETKPYWAKEQAAMTLRYMDSIPIDTSGLSDKAKQTLAEGHTAMEAIAGAKAGTVSLAGSNAKGIGISIAYEEALKTDPACAKAAVKGVEYAESFSAQWEMRQLLMDDLKELVKKEPVKNMKAEAEKSGPEKSGPEKAGAEKAGPEKAEAEKAEKEKSGPEKAEAEKAGAEKSGPEKAEKEKSGPEKAEAEKAGPEKSGGAKGKTEVTFVELELSEKEAKAAGAAAKPQSSWERHDLSPFHKESSRSFQKESGIGSHRQDNKKPAK